MQKEKFSANGAMLLLLAATGAGNMLMGFPMDAEQDTWISVLAALILTVPPALMYARMTKLMPEMNIYEMAEAAMGKRCAKITGIVFGAYCLHVASMVLGTYAEFIHLTSLFRTPVAVITFLPCAVCVYLAISGEKVLTKWCGIVFAVIIFEFIAMSAYSAYVFDAKNLMPVLNHSADDIGRAGFKIAAMSLGEIVIVMSVIGGMKKGVKNYKIFLLPVISAGILLTALFVRNCGILGVPALKTMYFPGYKAASLIKIKDFLERIEILLSSVYILAGAAKMAIAVIGASRGAANAFSVKNHKKLVIPVGVLSAVLSLTMFGSIVERLVFMESRHYYSLFFQIALPAVIWMAAEIKAKRKTLTLAEK